MWPRRSVWNRQPCASAFIALAHSSGGGCEAIRRGSAITSEGRTIVQATAIGPELAAILKKLDVAPPKPILAVG